MVTKVHLDRLVHLNGGLVSAGTLDDVLQLSSALSWHTGLCVVSLYYSSAPRLNYHLTNFGLKPPSTRWHQSLSVSFRDETWGQKDMHVCICIFYVLCGKNTQKWITMLWRLKLLVTLFSGP